MRMSSAIVFLFMITLAQWSPCQTQDVVKKMLPDGNLHQLVMPKPSEKASVILQLKASRTAAPQKAVQQIAFLLALLGDDYEKNRDYLLWALKGCGFPEIARGCDDMTAEYLINLYKHGHSEILVSLLRSSLTNYNSSGLETLGNYFSELVVKSPDIFLDTVSLFPISKQERICRCAGLAEGGGMASADLKEARKRLSAMNTEISKGCLRQIEQANKLRKR